MKRNDGGYVLVYVVAVIVLLCILVPAACSNSLRNLKAQQASIERMRQLYTAEGQIERFAAEISERVVMPGSEEKQGNTETGRNAVEEKFEAAFNGAESTPEGQFRAEQQSAEVEWNSESSQCLYKISVTAKEENVNISARITIVLTAAITTSTKWENETCVEYCTYQITACTITYDSYDISGAEGGAP